MLDKNNYVSFNKLYKSVKEVAYYDRLTNEYNQMTFNSLFFNSLGEYALSHYDYDKNSIVLNKRNVFTHMDDNTYYVSNKKGKLTIKSDEYDDYVNSTILNNEEVFNKMINDYEDFRKFHTEHLKDANIISVDGNHSLCLDLDNYKVAFKKNSNDPNWSSYSYIHYYNGTKSIEGNRDRVLYIKENESAYINRWVQIDKRVLPNWAKNAIKYYESKHKNFFSILVDKIVSRKQNIKMIDNDNNNKKVHIPTDELYDRVKIPNDVLFNRVDDHFEINENYINDLKYVDLSGVDFKDVLVSGIDFTDTNINFFDPQKVYKKDLSYCKFGDIDIKDNDVPFSHYTNFNGVNLCGTVIFGDSDFQFNLKGAITDNNTKIIYDHSALKYNKKK